MSALKAKAVAGGRLHNLPEKLLDSAFGFVCERAAVTFD
jgi:hypothetical protein